MEINSLISYHICKYVFWKGHYIIEDSIQNILHSNRFCPWLTVKGTQLWRTSWPPILDFLRHICTSSSWIGDRVTTPPASTTGTLITSPSPLKRIFSVILLIQPQLLVGLVLNKMTHLLGLRQLNQQHQEVILLLVIPKSQHPALGQVLNCLYRNHRNVWWLRTQFLRDEDCKTGLAHSAWMSKRKEAPPVDILMILPAVLSRQALGWSPTLSLVPSKWTVARVWLHKWCNLKLQPLRTTQVCTINININTINRVLDRPRIPEKTPKTYLLSFQFRAKTDLKWWYLQHLLLVLATLRKSRHLLSASVTSTKHASCGTPPSKLQSSIWPRTGLVLCHQSCVPQDQTLPHHPQMN